MHTCEGTAAETCMMRCVPEELASNSAPSYPRHICTCSDALGLDLCPILRLVSHHFEFKAIVMLERSRRVFPLVRQYANIYGRDWIRDVLTICSLWHCITC